MNNSKRKRDERGIAEYFGGERVKENTESKKPCKAQGKHIRQSSNKNDIRTHTKQVQILGNDSKEDLSFQLCFLRRDEPSNKILFE